MEGALQQGSLPALGAGDLSKEGHPSSAHPAGHSQPAGSKWSMKAELPPCAGLVASTSNKHSHGSGPGPPSKSSRTDPEGQELIQRHACLQALWNSGEAAHCCSASTVQGAQHRGSTARNLLGSPGIPSTHSLHSSGQHCLLSILEICLLAYFHNCACLYRKSLAPEPPEGEEERKVAQLVSHGPTNLSAN